MKFVNCTEYEVEDIIERAVEAHPADGLTVEIKYCPKGSCRYISGTYYRQANGFEDGRLIRIRINRHNRYPLEIPFKTSEYFKKRDVFGREKVYQKLVKAKMRSAEELIVAIFLHEYSHYLDHMEGRNGRYKQTKADKFAIKKLRDMGVL